MHFPEGGAMGGNAPGPPDSPWDDGNIPHPDDIQSAIRTLGISHEEVAELQGYIKRLLDEELDGRGSPMELLIMSRYQEDWNHLEVWRTEPFIKTQSALRKCVIALRLGIPLVASPRPLYQPRKGALVPATISDMPTLRASPESVRTRGGPHGDAAIPTGRPATSTGPTTRHAQTQTDPLHSEFSFRNRFTRQLRGHGEPLPEIRQAPRAYPTLVELEDIFLQAIAPTIEDTDSGDVGGSPILGNKRPPVVAEQCTGGSDYPAPLNLSRGNLTKTGR
ncbi:hypothetical protein MFIFM68171_08845 [Madurella fahalii]|uniref:Uncharacterized protein n=1 Tax=Madurella fahalii TaxID=1157608 RepID=A0ABQ0GLK8_9PEZI